MEYCIISTVTNKVKAFRPHIRASADSGRRAAFRQGYLPVWCADGKTKRRS